MQESKLPALEEWTEADEGKLADLVESDYFHILQKKILNRVAERNHELYATRDVSNIDRMDELLSFLSELENVGEPDTQ